MVVVLFGLPLAQTCFGSVSYKLDADGGIHRKACANKPLGILLCNGFGNGNENKIPKSFFHVHFHNNSVGHAKPTTAGHACENAQNHRDVSFYIHFRDPACFFEVDLFFTCTSYPLGWSLTEEKEPVWCPHTEKNGANVENMNGLFSLRSSSWGRSFCEEMRWSNDEQQGGINRSMKISTSEK